MKTRHILSGAVLLACALSASATEHVTNGTFDTNLSSWAVASSGATFTTVSSNGAAFFDKGTDTLSQTINGLVIGTTYTFDYDYVSGGTGSLTWSLAGATTMGSTNAATNYAGLSFQALTTSLTISFAGAGNGNSGTPGYKTAILDNVSLQSVSAVPEPETYAMMLVGLGAVGFVARRRKQA